MSLCKLMDQVERYAAEETVAQLLLGDPGDRAHRRADLVVAPSREV